MSGLISKLFLALDRQVEAITDRAFESAVAAGRARRAEPPTPREVLLQRVRAGEVTNETPGLQEAVDQGFVRKEAGRYFLTGLGDYLLPEAESGIAGVEPAAAEKTRA